MSVTSVQLLAYAGALVVLFLTPGPVWLALIARSMSGGFRSVLPLIAGVVLGDMIWPLLAIFGVGALTSIWAGFLSVVKLIGAAMFLALGLALLRLDPQMSEAPKALTRPGMWAGFLAGLAAIIGNPKAILFYLGLLPGFFDLSRLNGADIIAICAVSGVVPLLGNIALAASFDRVRRFLSSPKAVRRMNIAAGIAMIGVAIALVLL